MKRRQGPDNDADTNESALDLGLSYLIEKDKAQEVNNSNVDRGQEIDRDTADKFSLLAEKEDWEALSELSAKKIQGASSLDEEEAKLWWIKSQLYLKRVPVSILAAPLDSISRELEREHPSIMQDAQTRRIRELVKDLLQIFSEQLLQSGDERTSKAFCERLEKIFRVQAVSLNCDKEVQQTTEPDISGDFLNGKSERRKKPVQSEAERLRADLGIDASFPESVVESDPWHIDKIKNEDRSFWRTYFLFGLIIVAALGTLFWVNLKRLEKESLAAAAVIASPESNVSSRDMLLLGPKLDQIENIDKLSSLLSSMDLAKEKKDSNQSNPSQEQSRVSLQEEQVKKENLAPSLPREKEQIDTNSPREPAPEQRRDLDRPDPLWGDAERKERSPFGDDDAIGYPVQRFARPMPYAIIADTLVFPRPSLRGQPLQKLRIGDEILVDAKIGYWLRLRSQNNRAGFVLAQDAKAR